MPEEYKKAWKPHQKTRGILALYYYWCYQLGIFPKGTDYKPTSPLMKEELRKLDEITTQVRYMSEHNISTLSVCTPTGRRTRRKWTGLPTIGGICRIRYGVLHPPRKKRSEKKKTG